MKDNTLKNTAREIRKSGKSYQNISDSIGVAKSTVFEWTHDIEITDEQRKSIGNGGDPLFYLRAQKAANRKRELARDAGRRSIVSIADAYCVGLYSGEGSKKDRTWVFVNSNFDMIKSMVEWCTRAGQASNQFKAGVQVHPEDYIGNDEIREYWSGCGIPRENIFIYRIRSSSSLRKSKSRTPHGTCRVYPIKNGVFLYEYWMGQLEKISTLG